MSVRATSIAARGSLRPAAKQRARVWGYLLDKGADGATIDELHLNLNIPVNVVCPRRLELEEKLLVIDSGFRRPTSSGRPAIVWIIPQPVRDRVALLTKGTA